MDFSAQYLDGQSATLRPVTLRLERAGGGWRMGLLLEDGAWQPEKLADWGPHTQVGPGGGQVLVTRQLPQRRLELLSPAPAGLLAQAGLQKRGLARWLDGVPAAPRWLVAMGAAMVLALGLFAWAGVPWLTGLATRLVPKELEMNLGEQSYHTLTGLLQMKEIELTPPQRAVVEKLNQKLTAQIGGAYPVRVSLLEGDVANAVSLPGGRILIFRGMVNLLDTPSQLAALTGHELGHVAHRDGLNNLVSQQLLSALSYAVLGSDSALRSGAAGMGQTLLVLGYSREKELAADRYGLEMLKSMGLDPQAEVELMEKLLAAYPEGSKLPSFLSSHPDTRLRIQALKKALGPPPAAKGLFLTPSEWILLKQAARPNRPPPNKKQPLLTAALGR